MTKCSILGLSSCIMLVERTSCDRYLEDTLLIGNLARCQPWLPSGQHNANVRPLIVNPDADAVLRLCSDRCTRYSQPFEPANVSTLR